MPGIAPTATRRLGWVVGLTSTAYFVVVLDALVVTTALPRMHRDLGVGLPALQWTVNAYGIAFAAGIITAAATVLTTAFPAEKRGMTVGVYGRLAGLAALSAIGLTASPGPAVPADVSIVA